MLPLHMARNGKNKHLRKHYHKINFNISFTFPKKRVTTILHGQSLPRKANRNFIFMAPTGSLWGYRVATRLSGLGWHEKKKCMDKSLRHDKNYVSKFSMLQEELITYQLFV
jgi:hypothetical protein